MDMSSIFVCMCVCLFVGRVRPAALCFNHPPVKLQMGRGSFSRMGGVGFNLQQNTRGYFLATKEGYLNLRWVPVFFMRGGWGAVSKIHSKKQAPTKRPKIDD